MSIGFILIKKDIQEYKEIYKNAYGAELSDEEAEEYTLCFLKFMRAMLY